VALAAQTINLTTLNRFMRDFPSGIIVPELFLWNNLYELFKAGVSKDQHIGNNVEILMETATPFTFTAAGEGIDLAHGDPLGFVKMNIPLKEVQVTAEITKQMMDRATGGNASWGPILPRILTARDRDFLWGMELCAFGDGTGRLARIASSSYSGTTMTATSDSTYTDFGIENVQLLKKGMWIEAYDQVGLKIADTADGVPTATSTNFWKVTAVTFGDRANSTATTGTFTFECSNDLDSGTNATRCFDDGTVIYIAGTRSNATAASDDVGSTARYEVTYMEAAINVYTSLPMGLLGIVQIGGETIVSGAYTDETINCSLDTFQGLARASYPALNAKIWDGRDFGGSQGTPADWTLSAITDAMVERYQETGKWVTALVCNPKMAIALANQNATESAFTITAKSTGAFNQPVAGTRFATEFYSPEGKLIPIQTSPTIPANCVYGLCLEDMRWFTKGDFAPLKLLGDEWMFSPNQRKAVFEAPYGGYSQLGAVRCDSHFLIQDLKTNV